MSLPAPLVSHNQLLTSYSLQQTLRGQQSQPYACQQLRQMKTPTLQVVSNPPHHRVKHNLPWVKSPANINLWFPTLYEVWLLFRWQITSKHRSVRSEGTTKNTPQTQESPREWRHSPVHLLSPARHSESAPAAGLWTDCRNPQTLSPESTHTHVICNIYTLSHKHTHTLFQKRT